MEKELLELFESAKAAADAAATEGSSSEEARCVDALKHLKKFPMTMQALVDTQVGKRLRPLTKHPRERIQAMASDLLEIWKNIVLEETSKNKQNGSSEVKNSARAETAKVVKTQKRNDMKVKRISRAETIKVEKTDHKDSQSEIIKVEKAETITVEKSGGSKLVKVERTSKEENQASGFKRPSQAPVGPPKLTTMIKCNDAMRDKVRELLAEALSKVSSEADEDILDEVNTCDPIRIAVSVESILFEKMGRSNGPQKFKYRSVMFNIKDPNNPDLRRKVLLGEVKAERLVNMTPEEMASDQRKLENNQIKEKALLECQREGQAKATTDQFKCGRCGQRKCTYYQLQTRSADEPMTTFVTCVNCNNHWKFC